MWTRLYRALLVAVLLIPFAAAPGLAQTNEDLKAEIEALKKGQQNIQRQLAEIKRLVQQGARPTPQRPAGPKVKDVVFNLSDSVIKGDAGAKLTLIEFTDYQ